MDIKKKTIDMIDSLKATCQGYGMGNDGNEYKIITQMFLYKFLNDKFGYEIKKLNTSIAEADKWDVVYSKMNENDRQDLLDALSPDVPRFYPEHLVTTLWNQQTKGDFDIIFDNTMVDIANKNIDIFSTQTTKKTRILLFEKLTTFVTDETQRAPFARALIDKLVNFSFEEAFSQGYDFFATIFEYLIKDYNTDGGGKYAEYYTPHSIATIMAKILVGGEKDLHNIECYDPAAGTGTLLMALAHEVGEDKCTVFSQDISQKSNKMLKLNLILNGLVSSLDHVIQGDTLTTPYHKSDNGQELRCFDYIVCNPPFNMDFSETRDEIAAMPARFWAGVPNIPGKKKTSMAIYTCFIQHVINSLKPDGKAAIVVPSGFLTDTGAIQTKIRDFLLTNKFLKAVIQMPTSVFATTNTSVSVIFIDKSIENDSVMFVDASHMGESVKVDDNTRIVFSEDDENEIIKAITFKEDIPEFSVEIPLNVIAKNDNLIKPGLYFEMKYPLLSQYMISIDTESQIMHQRKNGLLRSMRSVLARDLIVQWFVDFKFPGATGEMYETDYGMFPIELRLVPLEELIEDTTMGQWGKEEPEGTYNKQVRCIRGTDIPNIELGYYDNVPYRFVQQKHIDEKRLKPNDIIIEISGGSPVQSTGRACFVTSEILEDLKIPVLCTNFCRIIRLKKPQYTEFIYNYIVLLYSRGYFFNLENNTTGIKNLIFSAFVQNIKVPIPQNDKLLEDFMSELNKQCENIIF